jgi:2-hydroxy-3-keto-5-methylthiopentenyl-1-phosphate phosphatase
MYQYAIRLEYEYRSDIQICQTSERQGNNAKFDVRGMNSVEGGGEGKPEKCFRHQLANLNLELTDAFCVLQLLFASMPFTRRETRRIRIVLDWDGTITKCDTLHIVAAIGYKRNRHLKLIPWDQIVQAYISDYSLYEDSYHPARPDRKTIAQESAWLASLNDVEQRSVKRVQDAGVFTDVTEQDICVGAEHAIWSHEIQLRDGWKDILSIVGHTGNNVANPSPISIISVNWSSAFIRACLSAALGESPSMKGTTDSIPIFSNHLHFEPSDGDSEVSSIRTSADKLDTFKKLRDSGNCPVFYVGDSVTDFDCLVAADVGICMRDEPMGSGQAQLKESLERVGIEVARFDLGAWGKHLTEIMGREGEKKRSKVVWWVTDLKQVMSFIEEYNEID